MAGNIVPRSDGGCNLGTPAKEFDKIYAKDIGGTLATKLAPLASPVLTGVPAAPTAAAGTSTTQIATTAFAAAAVSAHNADTGAHSGIIGSAVSTHNSSAAAHSDIRTAVSGKADGACPIKAWVAGTAYSVNDIVVQNKKIYQCITANSDAAFDAAKWQTIGGGADGVPIGSIVAFSGNDDLPNGYLECNGASVLRTMYPDLFTAIGTTYGATDDTHFNLPDLVDRFIEGSDESGEIKAAGLPNITGRNNVLGINPDSYGNDGAYEVNTWTAGMGYVAQSQSGVKIAYSTFDASKSSSVYGNSSTVQPPALCLRYVIKAFDGQTADSSLIDVTLYAQELANKANRNLSNLTDAGKAFAFPSSTYVNISPAVSTYVAPANGYAAIFCEVSAGGYAGVFLDGNMYIGNQNNSTGGGVRAMLPVSKGTSVKFLSYNVINSNIKEYFIYAEGEV